jgi:hypothetical protein
MWRWILAPLLAFSLLLGVLAGTADADTWPQDWHWPRWYATGSTATETKVYFVADAKHLAVYQREYVTWAAHRWAASPAVSAVPITAYRCPTRPDGIRYNCVVFQSASLSDAGKALISIDSSRHILKATVLFDWSVGKPGTYVNNNRFVACHEAGHALGGGFDDPRTAVNEHHLCNGSGYPTTEDYQSLAGAYNHHG